MGYLGNSPAEKYSSFTKQDFSTSATTSYTLSQAVANENEIALFINFVRQEPTTAYTASGTSLTLTSATTSSDDMYCVYLGKAVQTVNPPSGSVGSSQVAASIITGQTALGATPADTDELLISDAGTLKRVDFSYLKQANTPAFWVGQTSDQSYTNGSNTKIVLDNEVYDTHNAFSSNKFTVPSGEGGLYAFNWNVRLDSVSDGATFITSLYKNGSEVNTTRNRDQLGATIDFFHNGAATLSLAASDYIELYISSSGGSTNTDQSYVYLSGYKIIGVS